MKLFFSIIFLFVGTINTFRINQHQCQLKGTEILQCKYVGKDNYETDRLIESLKIITFDMFGQGSIIISSQDVPNLKTLQILRAEISSEEICRHIHAYGIEIIIEGKDCSDHSQTSTMPNPTEKYKSDHTTPNPTDKYQSDHGNDTNSSLWSSPTGIVMIVITVLMTVSISIKKCVISFTYSKKDKKVEKRKKIQERHSYYLRSRN
ncbi:hypothetical protein ACF0H5_015359 [Mactra antiquata]